MDTCICKISIYLTEKVVQRKFSIDDIQFSKVYFAFVYLIEKLMSDVILFMIFGFCGLIKELCICMVALILLREFVGGTHLKTNKGCLLATFLFTVISVVGGIKFCVSMRLYLVFLIAYLLIIIKYAPLISCQRPWLSRIRRKCIKIFAVMGSIANMIMFVYMENYRNLIGCVMILQFIDVCVDIYKRGDA